MKCTSALLHCTSLINEPPIVDALLPNDSAVEPESATEQAETSAGPTVLLVRIIATKSAFLLILHIFLQKNIGKFVKLCLHLLRYFRFDETIWTLVPSSGSFRFF